MYPYRRTFDFEAHFPFQYVYHDIKLTQHELPDHIHDWYELVYIHKGEGTFFIDHTFYEASEGDIFLIPGNTIHRSFPNDANPKLSTAFYFSAAFVDERSVLPAFNFLQVFDAIKQDQHFKLVLPKENQASCEYIIDTIHDEFINQKVGFEQQIRIYVQQLLIMLTRHAIPYTKPNSTLSYSSLPSWLQLVLTYIDTHLEEELHLGFLAKHVAVSPSHLSRVFKRYTGMNLTNYVNAKKMMKAKDLLIQSTNSVGEIASLCGFSSMTHFHRIFKQTTGLTPNQFKKEYT